MGTAKGVPPQRQTDMWNFPAFSKNGELVWLRATRSQPSASGRAGETRRKLEAKEDALWKGSGMGS